MDLKEIVQKHKDKNNWLYFKTIKDFYYKCQVMDCFKDTFIIIDRDGLILTFKYTDIKIMTVWVEKGVQ